MISKNSGTIVPSGLAERYATGEVIILKENLHNKVLSKKNPRAPDTDNETPTQQLNQEEHCQEKQCKTFENMILILDNGEEIDINEQYQNTNWLYAKVKNTRICYIYSHSSSVHFPDQVLNRSATPPEQPREYSENVCRTFERLAHKLLSNFDTKNTREICSLNTLNSKIKTIFKNSIDDENVWICNKNHESFETVSTLKKEDKDYYSMYGMSSEECILRCFILKPLNKLMPDKNEVLIRISKKRIDILRSTKDPLALETLEIFYYLVNIVEEWNELNQDTKSSEADFILAIYPIIKILFRRHEELKSQTVDVGSATYGRKLTPWSQIMIKLDLSVRSNGKNTTKTQKPSFFES
ncbi:hypothetical protein BDC45DRAFT_530032 [Circinella umbellata]|nr:hypothetical protein BDC45DRAFT_530032 [Circinella umbellata]